MNNADITPNTLVYDLLDKYPNLEEKLIQIAPVFKKLQNPVLRRTIARVTTLKQAAVVANLSLAELINNLRKEAGLVEMLIENRNVEKDDTPLWFNEENIKMEYDARIDLENGFHPAAKVSGAVAALNKGMIYKLITPFVPAPLIDIVKSKGADVFVKKISESEIETYIIKL